MYRIAASEIWLVIVNDQFLGAGEVYARPDHLAKWKFAFDFEEVLLFSREPGGGGEVIELNATALPNFETEICNTGSPDFIGFIARAESYPL